MTRWILPFALALPLLAAGCSDPGCGDVCGHAIYDCGWWNFGDDRDRYDECVDHCRDLELHDHERECLAEMECSERQFERCFDRRKDSERWPGRR